MNSENDLWSNPIIGTVLEKLKKVKLCTSADFLDC